MNSIKSYLPVKDTHFYALSEKYCKEIHAIKI